MNQFTLKFQATELDIRRCSNAGQVFRWQEIGNNEFLGIDGGDWYHIFIIPGCDEDTFEVTTSADECRFHSLFRLELSYPELGRQLTELGPELIPYLSFGQGLRMMRPNCATETLFSFLCTANNHLARIKPMVQKLGSFGSKVHRVKEHPIHEFPNIATIARLKESQLRELGFGYRAKSIPLVAQELESRGAETYLEGLRNETYELAFSELISIKSIGPKLADCIALFALDLTEATPLDTHMWNVVTQLYFPEWKSLNLTDQRYRTASSFMRNRFGKLSGFAHQFLFFHDLSI